VLPGDRRFWRHPGHALQERGELIREAEALLERRAQLQREIEDVERALSITPDDESVGRLLKDLRALTERLTTLTEEAKRIDVVIRERRSEIEGRKVKLQSLRERAAKEEFAGDDRRRMAQVAGRTQVVMQEFLRRATERKIDRLSELISESFRFLLRKQTMVERIHIDPTTFATTLFDQGGRALPKQRLSEGEKQIFAISILWGLSRASAHPLPAIIDTPMARLDAAHRRNLIERYFPNASHQVVILSTDTEVDRHYYHDLQPHIARAYHLGYDEESRATQGEEGYFWREAPEGGELRSRA
jgi:DNA sulfur modification protein DndD